MKFRGSWELALLSAFLVAGACSHRPEPWPEVAGDVPLLKATGWRTVTGQKDPEGKHSSIRSALGELSMRQIEPGGDLLFRRASAEILGFDTEQREFVDTGRMQRFPIYRYQVGQGRLVTASEEEWQRAGGDVRRCSADRSDDFRVDNRERTVSFRDRPLAPAGPLAIRYAVSNGKLSAAVLSAEGPAEMSLFLGGGGSRQQHYHQIFSIEKGEFIGDPVRLPLVSAGGVQMCWSPDDRFVIYIKQEDFAFVPVQPSEATQP